ncbi:MAG: hypothetical protein ACM3TT_10450 [Syntrophothermus sp.]
MVKDRNLGVDALPVPDFQLERWRDLLPAYAGYILALTFFPARAPAWATSGFFAALNPQWVGMAFRFIRLSLALLAICWLLGTVRCWITKEAGTHFWRYTRYFPRVWALSLIMAALVYLLGIAITAAFAPQDIRVILQDFVHGRAGKWWLPSTIFVSAAIAILPVFASAAAYSVLQDLSFWRALRQAAHYLFQKFGFLSTLWSFFVYLIAFAITLVFVLGAVAVSLIRFLPAIAPLAKSLLYVGGEVTWLLAITWFFRDLMEQIQTTDSKIQTSELGQKMAKPPDSI